MAQLDITVEGLYTIDETYFTTGHNEMIKVFGTSDRFNDYVLFYDSDVDMSGEVGDGYEWYFAPGPLESRYNTQETVTFYIEYTTTDNEGQEVTLRSNTFDVTTDSDGYYYISGINLTFTTLIGEDAGQSYDIYLYGNEIPNRFAFILQPYGPDNIIDVLDPLIPGDDVGTVINQDGNFWVPSSGVEQIGTINFSQGYEAFLKPGTDGRTITIEGDPLDWGNIDLTISDTSKASFIPWPFTDDQTIGDVFGWLNEIVSVYSLSFQIHGDAESYERNDIIAYAPTFGESINIQQSGLPSPNFGVSFRYNLDGDGSGPSQWIDIVEMWDCRDDTDYTINYNPYATHDCAGNIGANTAKGCCQYAPQDIRTYSTTNFAPTDFDLNEQESDTVEFLVSIDADYTVGTYGDYTFELITAPIQGSLTVDGVQFNQGDVINGFGDYGSPTAGPYLQNVTYQHDVELTLVGGQQTDSFTIRVTDAEGNSSDLTYDDITINPVEDATEIVSIVDTNGNDIINQTIDINEDETFTGTITVTDPDTDMTLTVGNVTDPEVIHNDGVSLNGQDNSIGIGMGTNIEIPFEITPVSNAFGDSQEISINLIGSSGLLTESFIINVLPVNDPPVISNLPVDVWSTQLYGGSNPSFTFNISDIDNTLDACTNCGYDDYQGTNDEYGCDCGDLYVYVRSPNGYTIEDYYLIDGFENSGGDFEVSLQIFYSDSTYTTDHWNDGDVTLHIDGTGFDEQYITTEIIVGVDDGVADPVEDSINLSIYNRLPYSMGITSSDGWEFTGAGPTITLSSNGIDNDGTISSYSWSYTTDGDNITTGPTNQSNITVLIPGVESTTNIVFSVTMTDNVGGSSTTTAETLTLIPIAGCMESDADLNYNPDVTVDDGLTCADGGCCYNDCAGNPTCDVNDDTDSSCTAQYDECGICNGPGAIYTCDSNHDGVNVCDGGVGGMCEADLAETCYEPDNCGICDGDCDGDGVCAEEDCSGICLNVGGDAQVDSCDVCYCPAGSASQIAGGTCEVQGANADLDDCGTCFGEDYFNDGYLPNGACGCEDDGYYPFEDCAGVCTCTQQWITIEEHNSYCTLPDFSVRDLCGVCNGGIFAEADCLDYPGQNFECCGCTNSAATNYDSDALFDDGNCDYTLIITDLDGISRDDEEIYISEDPDVGYEWADDSVVAFMGCDSPEGAPDKLFNWTLIGETLGNVALTQTQTNNCEGISVMYNPPPDFPGSSADGEDVFTLRVTDSEDIDTYADWTVTILITQVPDNPRWVSLNNENFIQTISDDAQNQVGYIYLPLENTEPLPSSIDIFSGNSGMGGFDGTHIFDPDSDTLILKSATIDGVEIPTAGAMVTRAEDSSILQFNYPTEEEFITYNLVNPAVLTLIVESEELSGPNLESEEAYINIVPYSLTPPEGILSVSPYSSFGISVDSYIINALGSDTERTTSVFTDCSTLTQFMECHRTDLSSNSWEFLCWGDDDGDGNIDPLVGTAELCASITTEQQCIRTCEQYGGTCVQYGVNDGACGCSKHDLKTCPACADIVAGNCIDAKNPNYGGWITGQDDVTDEFIQIQSYKLEIQKDDDTIAEFGVDFESNYMVSNPDWFWAVTTNDYKKIIQDGIIVRFKNKGTYNVILTVVDYLNTPITVSETLDVTNIIELNQTIDSKLLPWQGIDYLRADPDQNSNLRKSTLIDYDKRPDLGLFYYSENQLPKYGGDIDYWNIIADNYKNVEESFGNVSGSTTQPNVTGFSSNISSWSVWPCLEEGSLCNNLTCEDASGNSISCDNSDSVGTWNNSNITVFGSTAGTQVNLQIDDTGTLTWYAQFFKSGLDIEEGKIYEISFKAWCNDYTESLERRIGVRLQESGDDFNEDGVGYSSLAYKEFEIDGEMVNNEYKKYSFITAASNVTKPSTGQTLNPGVRLNFALGNFDERDEVPHTIILDDIEIYEIYDFTPDVDVRAVNSLQGAQSVLYHYYDEQIDNEKYIETSAPLEAQFYFYAREVSDEIFSTRNIIPFDGITTNGEVRLYVGFIDWGDDSPIEYNLEPKQLGNDVLINHSYNRSGIYEVTGWMFLTRVGEKLDDEGDVIPEEYDNKGVLSYRRFTIRINLNQDRDIESEFRVLGGEDYTFIPYNETTPVIGGISKDSIYYRTINRQLGYLSGSNDIIYDVDFKNYYDRFNTELALSHMDDKKVGETLEAFAGSYYSSDPVEEFTNCTGTGGNCTTLSENQCKSAENDYDGLCDWDDGYCGGGTGCNLCPEVDFFGNQVCGGNTWPCSLCTWYEAHCDYKEVVCEDLEENQCYGGLGCQPNYETVYGSLIYDGSEYLKDGELGDHLGDVDLGQVRYFADGSFQMHDFLGMDDASGKPDEPEYWKNIIPDWYTMLYREGIFYRRECTPDPNNCNADNYFQIAVTNQLPSGITFTSPYLFEAYYATDDFQGQNENLIPLDIIDDTVVFPPGWTVFTIKTGEDGEVRGDILLSSLYDNYEWATDFYVYDAGGYSDNFDTRYYSSSTGMDFVFEGIDVDSTQEWLDGYYYPVLPKLKANGEFMDVSNDITRLQNNGDNIPFGSERNWDEDDLYAPVTNLQMDGEFLDKALIDLDFSEIDELSLSDNSGNNNLGVFINDYRLDFDINTKEPRKTTNLNKQKLEFRKRRAF